MPPDPAAAAGDEGEERVRWYAEMQHKLFANPPEPEITDDEEDDLTIGSQSNSRGSARSKTASSVVPETPSYQSFVSTLAQETSESKGAADKRSHASSSTKLSSEKPLRYFPPAVLERSLIRLNSPSTIR